jgi:hypothetical protein
LTIGAHERDPTTSKKKIAAIGCTSLPSYSSVLPVESITEREYMAKAMSLRSSIGICKYLTKTSPSSLDLHNGFKHANLIKSSS